MKWFARGWKVEEEGWNNLNILNWSKVSEQNMEIIDLESQHNLIMYTAIDFYTYKFELHGAACN